MYLHIWYVLCTESMQKHYRKCDIFCIKGNVPGHMACTVCRMYEGNVQKKLTFPVHFLCTVNVRKFNWHLVLWSTYTSCRCTWFISVHAYIYYGRDRVYNKFGAAINRMITCIHDGLSPSHERTIPFMNRLCVKAHIVARYLRLSTPDRLKMDRNNGTSLYSSDTRCATTL